MEPLEYLLHGPKHKLLQLRKNSTSITHFSLSIFHPNNRFTEDSTLFLWRRMYLTHLLFLGEEEVVTLPPKSILKGRSKVILQTTRRDSNQESTGNRHDDGNTNSQ